MTEIIARNHHESLRCMLPDFSDEVSSTPAIGKHQNPFLTIRSLESKEPSFSHTSDRSKESNRTLSLTNSELVRFAAPDGAALLNSLTLALSESLRDAAEAASLNEESLREIQREAEAEAQRARENAGGFFSFLPDFLADAVTTVIKGVTATTTALSGGAATPVAVLTLALVGTATAFEELAKSGDLDPEIASVLSTVLKTTAVLVGKDFGPAKSDTHWAAIVLQGLKQTKHLGRHALEARAEEAEFLSKENDLAYKKTKALAKRLQEEWERVSLEMSAAAMQIQRKMSAEKAKKHAALRQLSA